MGISTSFHHPNNDFSPKSGHSKEMCGRFLLTTPVTELRRLFGLADLPDLRPRYNIAPTQDLAAIRLEGGERRLAFLRWGLAPPWTANAKAGIRIVNARAENIADKPTFRAAFRRRRALIPADGFYEWKTAAGGCKRPFLFRRRDRLPMALAALWESCGGLETAAIITTEGNATLRSIHDRMPAILGADDWEYWLDPTFALGGVLSLLRPAPDDLLDAMEVGPRINSVRNDDPACMEPSDGQNRLL